MARIDLELVDPSGESAVDVEWQVFVWAALVGSGGGAVDVDVDG